MDEKRKSNEQILPHKRHQNDKNYRQYYRSNKPYNHKNNLRSKQPSQECFVAHNENHINRRKNNSDNTDIDNSEQGNHSVEMGSKKTSITLLNEWAMHRNGSNKNRTCLVSYEFVAITGNAHKPVFTFMCRVNNKTAMGEGQSKKEAKQNSAAQMWKKLFEVSSLANSDTVISSTTTSNNLEVYKDDSANSTSAVGSQIKYENYLDMDNRELLHLKYEELLIAHSDINPIGALNELSTTYKWVPPVYSFQKSVFLSKGQQHHAWCKTVSYQVTCCVLHLQTTGTSNTKKGAKRIAARLMIYQISHIGLEKLSNLKLLKPKTILCNKECKRKKCYNIKMEDQDILPLEWNSANNFRIFFTVAMNVKTGLSSSGSSSESNYDLQLQEQQQLIKQNLHKLGLEQSIIQNNSNLNALDRLLTLCDQLGVQTTFVCVDHLLVKQQKKLLNGQDNEFNVLLQVSTVPITTSTGRGTTIEMATEAAAKCVLESLKKMLIFTSS